MRDEQYSNIQKDLEKQLEDMEENHQHKMSELEQNHESVLQESTDLIEQLRTELKNRTLNHEQSQQQTLKQKDDLLNRMK